MVVPMEHQQVQPEQNGHQDSKCNPMPEHDFRHVVPPLPAVLRVFNPDTSAGQRTLTIEPRASDGNIHPPVAAGGASGYFTAIME
jgi:hypothetical protein